VTAVALKMGYKLAQCWYVIALTRLKNHREKGVRLLKEIAAQADPEARKKHRCWVYTRKEAVGLTCLERGAAARVAEAVWDVGRHCRTEFGGVEGQERYLKAADKRSDVRTINYARTSELVPKEQSGDWSQLLRKDQSRRYLS
jgi:hypothetical protein